MKEILTAEKLPFLFTFIATVFFWACNSLISSEIDSPLVTYTLNEIEKSNKDDSIFKRVIKNDVLEDHGENLKKKHLLFTLQNLSSSTRFDFVSISLCFRKGKMNLSPQRFFGLDIIAKSPAGIDSSGNFYEPEGNPEDIYSTRALSFTINSFQPGNIYEVDFYTIYNSDIEDDPVPYVYCNTQIKVVKMGVKEWFIKNKFSFLMSFLILSLCMVILYSIWILKKFKI